MTAARIALGLFVLWALLWLASVLVPINMEATGDSFARGMNRVVTFFGLQFAAGMVAGILAIIGWSYGALGRLAYLPAALAGLLVLAVISLILWASFGRPDPNQAKPPREPTAEALPLTAPTN